MNYYNYPYMGMAYGNLYNKPSLFANLFKNKLNWGAILDNGQKTLNLINQSIPIIKQAQPIYKNARTMFKVMNEFKKQDKPIYNKTRTANPETTKEEPKPIYTEHGPTFFI